MDIEITKNMTRVELEKVPVSQEIKLFLQLGIITAFLKIP